MVTHGCTQLPVSVVVVVKHIVEYNVNITRFLQCLKLVYTRINIKSGM